MERHEYTPNMFHVIGDSYEEACVDGSITRSGNEYDVYNNNRERERTPSAYVSNGRPLSESLRRDINSLMMYTREICGEDAFKPETNLYEQTNEGASKETLI
jgi:hypothetical protein